MRSGQTPMVVIMTARWRNCDSTEPARPATAALRIAAINSPLNGSVQPYLASRPDAYAPTPKTSRDRA